jgi:hypothetical protein
VNKITSRRRNKDCFERWMLAWLKEETQKARKVGCYGEYEEMERPIDI